MPKASNEEKLTNSIDKFELEKKRTNFSEILAKINNIDSKKKSLWLEIYNNAVDDRERASMLFTEAYQTMGSSSADHVALGTVMAKYLERMSKSNDQIMSLATLIDKSERAEETMDPDALFRKIQE
jgi:Tfp pilus assembly protein PilF